MQRSDYSYIPGPAEIGRKEKKRNREKEKKRKREKEKKETKRKK